MDLSKIISLLKLKPKIYTAIFLVTGIITILPINKKRQLGIDEFYNFNKSIISLLMILSGVFVIMFVVEVIYKDIKERLTIRSYHKFVKEKLANLNDSEKKICKEALNNDGNVILNFSNNHATMLISLRVLSRISSISCRGSYFTYRLTDWVCEYLKKNPNLLE